ncbi:DinB family protein [Chitinophaga sp. MM2321]|uniref:DinB family protein n=1 Tax=Chitinophaga sp. MM2321 TaxID=3137178 RepID=UPI0032D5989C
MENNTIPVIAPLFINPAAVLEHWQGHRRLTRRVIAAFPEEQLFTYSVGGMRPFSELATEILIQSLGLPAVVSGDWEQAGEQVQQAKATPPRTKAEILAQWDEMTDKINAVWPQIAPGRFAELDTAFGQYEGPIYSFILYWIDNEVHHRGQGYVYLRALGIAPPPFWDRN